MLASDRSAISAPWVLCDIGQGPAMHPNMTVVIERGIITDVTDEVVADARSIALPEGSIVLPGLIDLHSHSLNGPLLGGTMEDHPRSADGTLVYDFLMPVGDLAARLMSHDDAVALYCLSLLRTLEGGTTTVVDVFRPDSPAFLDAAQEVGLRVYGAPYVASASITGLDSAGNPLMAPRDGMAQLSMIEGLAETYHGGRSSKVNVALGPHCSDTCSPELLQAIKRTARELDTFITIHAAQSKTEDRWTRASFGQSPIEYLIANGISGPDVIMAHCVFTTDDDLARLGDSGTNVASCPSIFTQGGNPVDYRRFVDYGITTGIATDGYSPTQLNEVRQAGFISKAVSQRHDRVSAAELIESATTSSAQALGRSDLGRIARGNRADLVAYRLDPRYCPAVLNPLSHVIWQPDAASVDTVIVDGDVVVRDGRHQTLDVDSLSQTVNAAVTRVWEQANERLGILPHPGYRAG